MLQTFVEARRIGSRSGSLFSKVYLHIVTTIDREDKHKAEDDRTKGGTDSFADQPRDSGHLT